MYKFKSYMMAMLAVGSMAFLTSCGDDDEPAPAPTLALQGPDAAGGDVAANQQITIDVIATDNGGARLDKFEVFYTPPGSNQQLTLGTPVTGINDANYNTSFSTTVGTSGTETYTFRITNKDGQATSRSVTFNITDPNAGAEINTFSTILMGGQGNGTYGSFLDADENEVYKQLAAFNNAEKIDIVYFHGATNQATLASPDDANFGSGANQIDVNIQNWSTRNQTRFKKLTGGQATYDAAETDTDLANAFNNASASAESKANQLTSGSYVAFMTDEGKYGIAKVGTITGTTNGTIQLTIKMEK